MAIVKRLTKGSALTHAELDGNFTDLDTRVSTLEGAPDSDSQTLTLVGTDLSISSGNTVDLSGLGGGGSSYDDSDVDTHLNTSTATANQILSWDGSDYVWVADQTGGGAGGIALTDLSVTTAAASGTPSLAYDNTTGVFTYTPPDLGNAIVDQAQYTTTVTSNAVDTSDTSAYIMGNTGSASITGTSTGWVFADVVQDPDNPGTTTILDVDNAIFTGSVVGDITTGTGTQTIQGTVDFTTATSVDFTGVTVNGLSAGSSYGDSDVATYLNGNLDSHIIPDTNATYDIGSAEFKIRHFYLSDNSLKFTDTSDPQNIVEYSMGRTGTDITFNGSALKNTSTSDVADASVIDITKTNHFVTNGTTASLPDGTYMGQKLEFWRSAGAGTVDITVNSAIYMDGGNVATGPGPIAWRLGDANQTLYSCIWNGVAWVLSHGGPGV